MLKISNIVSVDNFVDNLSRLSGIQESEIERIITKLGFWQHNQPIYFCTQFSFAEHDLVHLDEETRKILLTIKEAMEEAKIDNLYVSESL